MTILDRPQRTGFRLTEEAEALFSRYLDKANDQGCTCFSCAPCTVCTHEGHPYALEGDDSAWEPEEAAAPDFSKITSDLSRL